MVASCSKGSERAAQLRADYALELSAGFPVAVVEAKREYAQPGDGLQQAKEYAALLDLPVALATNGHGIWHGDGDRPSIRQPGPATPSGQRPTADAVRSLAIRQV
jgi:type I site-specific restriction endonuclease